MTAIARVTRGNFQLVERIFAQIKRVVQINQLPTITPEVVAVASEAWSSAHSESADCAT